MRDDAINWRCPKCGYYNNSDETYDITSCRDCGYSHQQNIAFIQKYFIDEQYPNEKPVKKTVKKKSIKKKVVKSKKKTKTLKLHLKNCKCPLHRNNYSLSKITEILNRPVKVGSNLNAYIEKIVKDLKKQKITKKRKGK